MPDDKNVMIRTRGENIMRFDIRLDGYIVNCDQDHDDFVTTFTQWIESNGWGYAGMSLPVTEEEDIEAEIEKMLKNEHYKKWGFFVA
jgi:hypothetical protein